MSESTGKPIKIKSEGLEARCFQHEIHYLDGILFINHIEDWSTLYRLESPAEEEEMDQDHAYT